MTNFNMDRNIVVLEYQDNFAENLSVYAYAKIAENKFNVRSYWENTTEKRQVLEEQMGDFNLNCSYICKNRFNEIRNRSNFMDYRDFTSRNLSKDKIISLNNFKIDDIKYITDDIKNELEFNNLDFIKNYDILEKINADNSIGVYISPKDEPNISYIQRALKRVNKYLKKPKAYIFYTKNLEFDSEIPYETITLLDWREEFYFLKNCRHKIIHCTKNSYSFCLWASILSDKKVGYTIYDKKLNALKPPIDWIKV